MHDWQDIVFQVDTNTGSVLFLRGGIWPELTSRSAHTDSYTLLDSFVQRYVHSEDRATVLKALSTDAILAAFMEDRPLVSVKFRALLPDSGAYEWFYANTILPKDGVCYGTVQYIQREMEEESAIRYSAEHDTLTGLLSRPAFERQLAEYLGAAAQPGVFMITDIVNFGTINERNGHTYGDMLLSDFAAAMGNSLPPGSLFGRFGGDEFLIFCPGIHGEVELSELMSRLMSVYSSFPDYSDTSFHIGAALYPEHGRSMRELLDAADKALKDIKPPAKNGFSLFSDRSYIAKKNCPPVGGFVSKASSFVQNPSSRRLAVSLLAAVLLFVGILYVLMITYTQSLEQMVRRGSINNFHQISQRIDTTLTDTLTNGLTALDSIGNIISDTGDIEQLSWLRQLLSAQKTMMGYDHLSLITENGDWYLGVIPQSYAEIAEQAARSLDAGETFITVAQENGADEFVVCAVPISPVTVEGITFRAIVAYINLDTLNRALSLTAFDGVGLVNILEPDGDIVICFNRDDAYVCQDNMLTRLEAVELAEGYKLDTIRGGFAEGQDGIFLYSDGGTEFIAYYSGIPVQNWVLYSAIPVDALESHARPFIQVTVYACIAASLVCAILTGTILLIMTRDRKKIETLAFVDNVTGGSTRVKLLRDIKRLTSGRSGKYSIIYVNIERFKLIGDRFGRNVSDALLRYISKVFSETLRPDETCGRLMADHFCILAATQDRSKIEARIQRWNASIDAYPHARENLYSITASYGVYQIEEPELEPERMIDRANIAMGNTSDSPLHVAYYDNIIKERMRFEQELVDHMDSALLSGEFKMFLQPQYSTKVRKIIGFEALVRWEAPSKPCLSPGQFIPLFERNGSIVKLDLHIFDQACAFLSKLRELGYPTVRLSVNVSRVHLKSDSFLSEYLAVWNRYTIPPENLEFEFTESVIYDNSEKLSELIDELHRYGFKCSIDDFGAGFSSLNMLHKTRVDTVKLDKSFLGTSSKLSQRSAVIIRSVVRLVKDLGMHVISEGVEYSEQADFLTACGCDYLQGYYFAKPMTTSDALKLLESENRE